MLFRKTTNESRELLFLSSIPKHIPFTHFFHLASPLPFLILFEIKENRNIPHKRVMWMTQ